MIQKRKFSFVSKYDGVTISGVCMVPENPIGILQMVHGMNEYKDRYLSFMQSMAERGYITLMHDNRGHGESIREADDIGYCYSAKEKGYIEDTYSVTKKIRHEYPELPLILYGHSMGSLIVRSYLQKHDDAIDALIVSGCPSYNDLVPIAKVAAKVMRKLAGERLRSNLAQQIVSGSFESRFKAEGRKYAWLAANKSVGKLYEQDTNCTFVYTLNGYEALLNLELITYRRDGYQVRNPKLPVLFISGKEDPCYINEKKWTQAIKRMRDLGYENITDIRYEGMRHEIHNEVENNLVYEEIAAFCKHAVTASADQSQVSDAGMKNNA